MADPDVLRWQGTCGEYFLHHGAVAAATPVMRRPVFVIASAIFDSKHYQFIVIRPVAERLFRIVLMPVGLP